MKQNVETFIGCDADYAAARIVLFGAPFDSTTSFRPGARFGSAAIRHEASGWKRTARIRIKIWKISPYLTAAI